MRFNVLLARIDVAADPKGTAKLLRNIGWVGQRLLAPLSLPDTPDLRLPDGVEARRGFSRLNRAVASKEKTFTLVARAELVLLVLVGLDMTLKPGA